MKKVHLLMLASIVIFSGCSKSEPDPVIVNIPDDADKNYPIAEISGIDFNEPEASDTEFTLFDVNSLAGKSEDGEKEPDVVFVPTPNDVVARMLELAQVQKDDLLYDLGCGDGRIVVTAAKQFGCRAFGYDVDPKRIKESLDNVATNNVGDMVTIEKKDIFTLDLSEANVITLYLLPSLNVRLIPQLEKLRPGSRIVSHDFNMRGVKPEKVEVMTSVEDENQHTVYLWITPLKKEEETSSDADEVSMLGADNQLYEVLELPKF